MSKLSFVFLFCLVIATADAAEPVDIKTLFDSIPEAEQVKQFDGYTVTVKAIAWSPDGKRILSGGFDKQITLRDYESGEILHTAPLGMHVNNVAFVTPSEFFYTGRVMCIADPDSPDPKKDQNGVLWHGPGVPYNARTSVRADGKVACFANKKALQIWDLEKRRLVRAFETKADTPLPCDMEPSGKRVVVASGPDATIYDAEMGKVLKELEGVHGGAIKSCVFGSDDLIVTGDDSGTMIVWDAKTGDMIHCVTNFGDIINALAFSHDGTKLAVAIHASPGYVFDTKIWKPICRLPTKSDWNVQVAWDPTDTKLAVANARSVLICKIPDSKQ